MNRTLIACSALLLATPLLAGPINPPAGPVASTLKTLTEVEPRIALSATNTPGTATGIYRITQPGSYYLTGNLNGVTGKNGIEINSGDVSIDLGGFEVLAAAGSLAGVTTIGSGWGNIRVSNGSIRNWAGGGVDLGTAPATNCALSGLSVTANGVGIRVGNGATITDCQATSNTNGGIFTNVGGLIVRCTCQSNGVVGINAGQGTSVLDCMASNQTGSGDGIITGGAGCVVSRCIANGNAGKGINAGSVSTITNCSVFLSQSTSIVAANGCVISGCSINFGQVKNMIVGDGCTVSGCSIQYGNGGGLECSSNCTIRDNTCASNANGNSGAGITVTGTRNRIEGNLCTNATTGIAVTGTANVIARNTCAGNSTNWNIAVGNVCYVTSGIVGAAAIVGNSGGTAGSTDPNANFTH